MQEISEQQLLEKSITSSEIDLAHHYLGKETDIRPAINFKVFDIFKYIAVATLLLLVIHSIVIASYHLGFKFYPLQKFYFDQENSVPTFFSSVLLLMAAATLSLIALLKSKYNDGFAVHWTILAFIFIGLSIDESASFHEVLIKPMRETFQLSGFLKVSWVLAGALFLLIFCFSYIKFFLALSRNMKFWFFISGAVYVLGVLGVEMIGGNLFVESIQPIEQSLTYQITMTLEETLEMSGIVIFIFTLLSYIKAYFPKIDFSIS